MTDPPSGIPDAEPEPGHVATGAAAVFDEVMAALATWPDAPSYEDDPAAFVEWAAASAVGGHAPVPRYFEQLRRMRHDLLVAYPEVPGRDAAEFCEWVAVYGCTERGLSPDLFCPVVSQPERIDYCQAGVNLVGMFTAELGMAEVARRIASALDTAHVPYTRIIYEPEHHRRTRPAPAPETRRFDTNVVCLNPDSLPRFTQQVGTGFYDDRHTVGVWFWETDRLSSMFHSSYRTVDELWAASDYVADALRADAPADVQIVRFPMPVLRPQIPPGVDRAELGLPANRFVFLTSFDYRSVMFRKNPIGAIEAFRAAFADGEGPLLVVKSTNAASAPDAAAAVARAAAGRTDIVLRDELLPEAQNLALLARVDCFVSLHRSEGLGFNLADAIALGVPLVATAASGNMAFCRPEHVWLVDAVKVPVGDGRHPYEPDSHWFEPDLTQAAAHLRTIADRPDLAAERAAAGAAWITAEFSLERTGRFIRDRLAAARAEREPARATPTPELSPVRPALLARLRARLAPSPIC